MQDKWIWLPVNLYPDVQTTRYDALSGVAPDSYAVVDFKRSYEFDKKVKTVKITVCGDTLFRLFCNGEIVATGPASVGGDFLRNGEKRSRYYAYETEYYPNEDKLTFFATVQMMPVQICEYSKGHGGFMLVADVLFVDGTQQKITTDKTWLVRLNRAYVSPKKYDATILPDEWVNAEKTDDIWDVSIAPIPVRDERELDELCVELMPGEEKTVEAELDMIYAGYIQARAVSDASTELTVKCSEIGEKGSEEKLKLNGISEYRGFYMHSAGKLTVTAKNYSNAPATLKISFITTCYPVKEDASTVTDDKDLNRVLDLCKHTLKYCRQTHHLDSPRHCEPLACTGDYYVEALMTAFSFGDQRLSEFDVLRTAELLRSNDGRMFHTTYSLIWVRMLYDTYMLGGNKQMLYDCADALKKLLSRFSGYVAENGLIENPPDYMFVDWIYIDEISMHHPPKCLGQTALNMFYYMALTYAEKIYTVIALNDEAERCKSEYQALKNAINENLYDPKKEMYFEGLNTPTDKEQIYKWLPENSDKRYYLKHSNILAAYTCVCDTERARALIDKIMSDEIEGDVQPYFLHYLFEAIFIHGLREKYTLKLAERWKKPTLECKKGLVEGFVAPEPTYRFDHSHAWGGTPLWSIPRAILGLDVIAPAFAEITIQPHLLGLGHAKVELPTPHGMIICEMNEDKPPVITAPKEIKINYR